MNCAELRDALERGMLPEGDGVVVHLEHCTECAARLDARLAALRGSESLEPEEPDGAMSVRAELLASIEQETGARTYLRSRSTRARVAILTGLAIGIGLTHLALRPRPDVATYPLASLFATVALLALPLGAAIRLALRPLSLPPTPLRTVALTILTALLVPFAIAVAPMHGDIADGLERSAAHCLGSGAAMACLVFAAWWTVDRGPTLRSLLLSTLAAGLSGTLMLQLACPSRSPAHLVTSHATLPALACVLGLGMVAWMRRRRIE